MKENRSWMKEIGIWSKEIDIRMKEIGIRTKEIGIRMKEIDIRIKEIGIRSKEIDIRMKEIGIDIKGIECSLNNPRYKSIVYYSGMWFNRDFKLGLADHMKSYLLQPDVFVSRHFFFLLAFKSFFSSPSSFRCSFFTSSAGGRFSGTIPL